MARRRRPNRLAAQIQPTHLFIAGVVVIAGFLFQQNLLVRIGQVFVFAGLAVLAGKRIRWGYFLVMVASITVFNLLTPVGEVLLRAGPVVITRGALQQGLMKGFAIPGLVFISLFAVAPSLRLPGRLGGLTARLFFYFEHLLEGRKRVRLRNFVDSVDAVLVDLLESTAEIEPGSEPGAGESGRDDTTSEDAAGDGPAGAEPVVASRTTALGYLITVVLAGLSLAPAVLFGTY